MSPIIVNLDSAFDWTAEVRQVWDALDWDGIRQATAPQIPSEQWTSRGNELGLVGLVSSLLIDDAYHLPHCEEDHDRTEQPEDPLSRDWRERQLRRGGNENEGRNNLPNRGSRFNGEESFFRSPCTGRMGVVECYGIYADDAATILCRRGLLEKAPPAVRHAPAIFLCPERIHDIYPTVIRLGEDLRHPLPLSLNPALANLRTTLLHELGHHFFPVHRSGAGRFLSEALANLFCYHGLDPEEQAWLFYKSWHLQPPEYSSYRPLNVLCAADADSRSAVASCFHADLGGWASLPKKDSHTLERALGASVTMALAADSAACKGLWWDELRQIVSDENRWFLHWEGNHRHFRLNRHPDENIPPDFVLDLYQQSDLANWAEASLPTHIWGRWAYGDEVQWPHDAINFTDADLDRWLAYYASAKDTPLASVICEKLVALLHANPDAINHPGLRAALDHALAIATNDQAFWFDRVPAIQLIETCADTGSFPASDARWMFAHFTVELQSVAAAQDYGDVHDAALKAVASLRAAALKHWNGDTTG